MNKYYIYFICICVLGISCYAPKNFRTSDHLFENVIDNYPTNEYDYQFKTTGKKLVNLSNISIDSNGNINAIATTGIKSNKVKIVIISDLTNNKSRKHSNDSSNNSSYEIKISSDQINKILLDRDAINKNKDLVVYNKNPESITGLRVMISILVILALLLITYVVKLLIILYNDVASCYIATLIYKSYDAQEVLILRRFRDESLAPYFLGRVFIGIYYATSPYFIKIFKNSILLQRVIKFILDRWVRRLIRVYARKDLLLNLSLETSN